MRFRGIAAVVLLFFVGAAPAFAQDQPKADLFLGYSFLHPNVRAGQGIPGGFGAALNFNPTRPFGLTADFGFHRKNGLNDFTYMFGPKITARGEKAMPFFEALFGGSRLSGGGGSANGFAMALGGGLDLKQWQHVGIRLFQADYLLQRFSGVNNHGVRAQTGLLFLFGGEGGAKALPSATCSASPTEVMAGEPVTVTGSPANFNPKHTVSWTWNSNAGKVSGSGTSATVDTSGLAPGQYRVSGHATDGKKEMADCAASFTVKEPPRHPPTITCSPERSTVMSGDQITITCTGMSPDQRPLKYAWESSAGSISGQDTNATMASTGLSGPVTITTTVTDDRGLSAQATTNVSVQTPPPPPPTPPAPGTAEAIRQDLQQKGKTLVPVHFDTAKATIRPDSEEILTNAAQVLKEDPQMYVFVDGHTDSRGGKAMNLALSKRRAAAVRTWLIQHGVDANRMVARGFGLEKPVGDNNTDEGRQANRRVELVVMSDAEKAQAATKAQRKK